MKDPRGLLDAGKYGKALQVLEFRLEKDPHDGAALATLPYAFLCVGRLEEALEGFQQSNMRAKLKPIGHKHPYLREIATVQWLLGRREEAISTLRFSVDGILDGTIEYADATGGTPQGLLLWYMGVSVRDDETSDHALEFLRTVISRTKYTYAPSLGEFAIGKLDKAQLLRSVFSTRTLWMVRLQARIEKYKRIRLSKIWFYFGVQARAAGDEAECKRCMKESSRLGHSAANMEWHLAKAEVDQEPSK